MSSFPRLNLIGDSDIDLGLLVYNLDNQKLFEISKILINNGYKYGNITYNKASPKSTAYRFEKKLKGVEVEIKIRDMVATRAIAALHTKMDKRMSKEHQIFWTYHKYLLKNLSKKNKAMKPVYRALKIIFHHYYFDGIKGAFSFY